MGGLHRNACLPWSMVLSALALKVFLCLRLIRFLLDRLRVPCTVSGLCLFASPPGNSAGMVNPSTSCASSQPCLPTGAVSDIGPLFRWSSWDEKWLEVASLPCFNVLPILDSTDPFKEATAAWLFFTATEVRLERVCKAASQGTV